MNDIVEFFSLQKVSALKYPEQCASASERLGLTASCTTKKPPESLQASPFVLPPARGASEGAEVGQSWPFSSGVRRTSSGEKGLTLRA